jgi:hypothetical protein
MNLLTVIARIRSFNILQKYEIKSIVALHLHGSVVEAIADHYHQRSCGKLLDESISMVSALVSLDCESGNVSTKSDWMLQKHKTLDLRRPDLNAASNERPVSGEMRLQFQIPHNWQ